jgi:hypothetical protein
MTDILHTLSSNFTTCDCGEISTFVKANPSKLLSLPTVDLGPLVGKQRGFWTKERIPSSGMAGAEMSNDISFASLQKGKGHGEAQWPRM